MLISQIAHGSEGVGHNVPLPKEY